MVATLNINNNKFEYVMSGMSFTRINSGRESWEDKDCFNFIGSMFKKMREGGGNHDFSYLFNGWTEVELGKCLSNFKDHVCDVYADSGGLQLQTQGKIANDSIKDKVYASQAELSSKAFIFDEPPLEFCGTQISKHDIVNRVYNNDLVDEFGILTGKNVKRQLEVFLEKKTETKSMIIVHGNCLDSYQRTLDRIMEFVSKENYPLIGGIAIAGGCLGKGTLEDIKKGFYFSQLKTDLKVSQLHILGVGSIYRFLPLVIFSQNGLFKDLNISYDSTTHSSGMTFGRYYMPGCKQITLSKSKNEQWESTYENVKDIFNSDMSFDEFFEAGISSSYIEYEKRNQTKIPLIKVQLGVALASAYNFIQELERYISNPIEIRKKLYEDWDTRPLSFLYDVKNKDDFDYWLRNFESYIRSTSVDKKDTYHNISEFF